MKRALANPNLRVLFLSLLGISAVFLPWCRLTIFDKPAYISGYNLWQGKTVGALFLAAAILTALVRKSPKCKAVSWTICGIAIAVVATQYLFQILMPAPTQIDVQQGGAAARDVAQQMVNQMEVHLSLGPFVALILGCVVLAAGVLHRGGTNCVNGGNIQRSSADSL